MREPYRKENVCSALLFNGHVEKLDPKMKQLWKINTSTVNIVHEYTVVYTVLYEYNPKTWLITKMLIDGRIGMPSTYYCATRRQHPRGASTCFACSLTWRSAEGTLFAEFEFVEGAAPVPAPWELPYEDEPKPVACWECAAEAAAAASSAARFWRAFSMMEMLESVELRYQAGGFKRYMHSAACTQCA